MRGYSMERCILGITFIRYARGCLRPRSILYFSNTPFCEPIGQDRLAHKLRKGNRQSLSKLSQCVSLVSFWYKSSNITELSTWMIHDGSIRPIHQNPGTGKPVSFGMFDNLIYDSELWFWSISSFRKDHPADLG